MSSIEDDVKYPMEDDDWLITILIGGGLMLFSFLILPIFIVYGYFMNVVRESTAESPQVPKFEEWGDLFVDGLKVFVIGFVYMIIPTAVFAFTVLGSFIALLSGEGGIGLVGLMGGLFVSSILYLIFSYVTVAAIVNYAREEEISAGFDISMLTDVLTTSEYAMGWLLGVGILFVAGIVVSVVSIVPLIGAIAGIFINFYALIVAFRIWGRAVDDALTAGGSVGTSAGQPAE